MTIKKNSYHNLLLFASVLLVFIPPALISGPFIPDLFIVIISIIFLYIYSHNKDELILFRSFFFKLFLVFYIYLILVSILSDHFYQSLKPSLTYIRFGLFSLAIFFILTKKKDFKLQFFIVLYFTIFILIFDGYFQFIFGKNIFGYEVNRPDRLSSFFFDELILGSYLGKILPIFCIFCLFNKKFINKHYISISILLIYILIFLSGERSAFLTTTLYLIMISPFFIDLKKGIVFFMFVILILGILISYNKNIKSRYVDQMIAHTIPNVTQNSSSSFLPEHMDLFKSAIKIFKQNIFFGGGIKTFRIYCKNFDNKVPDYTVSRDPKNLLSDVINQNDCAIYKTIKNCSTHPHNYYLQLLSETGLIGFIFVFGVFLKLVFNYFRQFYYLFKNKSKMNQGNVLALGGLIVFIWPIITTGSFFNNWICSILFLQVGVYLYILKNETKN